MPAITRIRAGELRHWVQIMQLAERQDANGNISKGDAGPFAAVWARIEALSGRELYNAQQKVSQVTHRITIRYQPGVKAQMLVWFRDPGEGTTRQFQIEAIENPDETMHKLFLLCIERDNSQREP
jgi:SPP1 family predicted phage head-tail adaptor